ncbi:MAG TPA: hypothetical protein VNI79_04340 [Sphingomicrobium sp.]|nr:hypothetical protein [Sphingomicrobium sp.]
MSAARTLRQKLIGEILRAGGVASQEEVSARLLELGHDVTQATVSRDLSQLGAVKIKRDGVLNYALPEQIGPDNWAGARLAEILAEWVRSIETSGSTIVLKTPPGSAHLVAIAIDQTDLPDVAGTISGDDTLFIAVRDGVAAGALAERLRLLSTSPRKLP